MVTMAAYWWWWTSTSSLLQAHGDVWTSPTFHSTHEYDIRFNRVIIHIATLHEDHLAKHHKVGWRQLHKFIPTHLKYKKQHQNTNIKTKAKTDNVINQR